MDVNGSRFHLLLGRRDFEPLAAASSARGEVLSRWFETTQSPAIGTQDSNAFHSLVWDDNWDGIGLARELPVLSGPKGAAPLRPEDRRGVGADAFGDIFWIAQDRARIRLRPAGMDLAGDFWSAASAPAPKGGGLFHPETPNTSPRSVFLSGLAVTASHYLVAGTRAPGGLLIFDLNSSGGPIWWRWPDAIAFAPLDIAATADGGVVILDRPDGGDARLWRLNSLFGVVNLASPLTLAPARQEDFHAEGMPPSIRGAKRFAGPVEIEAASPIEAENPVALLELPDGSVLILNKGAAGQPSCVQRWVGGEHTHDILLDGAATSPHLGTALTDAHDFAFIGDAAAPAGTVSGQLFLATADASQVFGFALVLDGETFTLSLQPTAFPLQRFAGKGLASAGGQIFYDSAQRDAAAENWYALAEQPRYRYFPEGSVEPAVADNPIDDLLIFDGKLAGCVWHRVLLDAFIPHGCEVAIQSLAADERSLLDGLDWENIPPEPRPYRRGDGSELPFDRPFGAVAGNELRLGTFETLLQSAIGRYLALRLTLRGDGRASPRLRALRVYYPRFSYLQQYLPACYRDDIGSADFLERYLCNVEGLLTAMEGRIERAEVLFDPKIAPADFLPWLAEWMGAMLDENWEETRRRLFLRYAWLLFLWRGTSSGLLAWLRLATDSCPGEAIFAPLLDYTSVDDRSPAGKFARHSLAKIQANRGCQFDIESLQAGGSGYGAWRPRIVESFELRSYAAATLGDPTGLPAPALRAPQASWQPGHGGSELNARFAEYLRSVYRAPEDSGDEAALERLNQAWQPASPITGFSQIRFSAVLPVQDAKAADWRAFTGTAFDFDYEPARTGDAGRYREFLARRYGRIEALNQAYGRQGSNQWAAFAEVSLPAEDELPADGAPLNDWIRFVSLALPIARDAHRFSVLVPASPFEDPRQREQRKAKIEALVWRERPAHTDFDVKLFWELFQVGKARLGIDSLLGEGGRFVAMALDAGYLGEAYLAEGFPWSATGRAVVGRDRMQR